MLVLMLSNLGFLDLKFFWLGFSKLELFWCASFWGDLTQGVLKGCNVLTVGYKAFFKFLSLGRVDLTVSTKILAI